MSIVRAKVIRIGNSKGIRLPKVILEQYHITDQVELVPKQNHIALQASSSLRSGWELAFKNMHKNADDSLLINDEILNKWDDTEWEW
jgi:antitoxin MazE